MRAAFSILALAILFTGCAQQPTKTVVEVPVRAAPALTVPTTGWVATRAAPIDAAQVLTGPEGDWLNERAEKIAYGPVSLGGVTAYTTFTYDAQRISTPDSTGYRYRWVWQSGVSEPVAP